MVLALSLSEGGGDVPHFQIPDANGCKVRGRFENSFGLNGRVPKRMLESDARKSARPFYPRCGRNSPGHRDLHRQ